MVKSRNILPPKRFWKPWEEEFLRKNYADSLTVDLAKVLDMTIKRVLAKANAMGLKKSIALIAETARERTSRPDHGSRRTRIKPGQKPWNKGTHYVAGGRSAETRFKPGIKPPTWVPVGSYRVVEGQLQRKVNDDPGPNTVRWHPVCGRPRTARCRLATRWSSSRAGRAPTRRPSRWTASSCSATPS
jgi:hypothetical protein